MEEETGFRRSMTPPDTMEDYRSAVADSTSSNPGRNDPIPISYRPIEPPNNDANTNRPTAISYVNNGGVSINSRPRLPEPAERGEGPVDLDVDFDNKMTDAYAKLDDARDNYHMARSASYQYSPERMNAINPIYKGVPNTSKKEKKQACRTCFLHSCLTILVVTNVAGLLLGGFNLANTFNIGSITSDTTPPASSTEEGLQETIQQLRTQLSELRGNFNLFNEVHTVNFSAVKNHLAELQEFVNTFSTTTSPDDEMTTPLATATPTSRPSDNYISIPLYENCTITLETVCLTNAVIGTTLTFQYCSTTDVRPTVDDSYVTEVFCSINSEQVKPVTSSLSYNNGAWSCICQGVEIPNEVESDLARFNCELYVKRCPSSISVPRN